MTQVSKFRVMLTLTTHFCTTNHFKRKQNPSTCWCVIALTFFTTNLTLWSTKTELVLKKLQRQQVLMRCISNRFRIAFLRFTRSIEKIRKQRVRACVSSVQSSFLHLWWRANAQNVSCIFLLTVVIQPLSTGLIPIIVVVTFKRHGTAISWKTKPLNQEMDNALICRPGAIKPCAIERYRDLDVASIFPILLIACFGNKTMVTQSNRLNTLALSTKNTS